MLPSVSPAPDPRTVLVTGGAGFIGATVCDQLLEQPGIRLINFDKLTYAANPDATVREVPEARYSFVQGDVCDREALTALFATYQPDAVIHLAAETHVDRSIMGAPDFVMTNLVGTQTLLDVTRDYWQALDAKRMRPFRLIHVSTDEVFGTLTDPDLADESTPYAPRSPYAATKAGADQLAEAARITHGLPVTIAYGTNAYGPRQFPEKLVPLMITKALLGAHLPIYGDGLQVRDWLHVDDFARALITLLNADVLNTRYVVGARSQRTNLSVVKSLCDAISARRPDLPDSWTRIQYVTDRPGHDRRYGLDPTRIETDFGWAPLQDFETGLAATVDWYLSHPAWWQATIRDRYNGERLGL